MQKCGGNRPGSKHKKETRDERGEGRRKTEGKKSGGREGGTSHAMHKRH